jgi:hypothetical protein
MSIIKLPEPTEQRCQVCGHLYTGIRTRLCENMKCRKWFAMEREANAWKYGPISYPRGAIFYDIGLDAEECSVEKEDHVQTRKKFFDTMVEFGEKLMASEKPKTTKEDCVHNWVMEGHNAGDPICSKCYSRE